MLRTIFLLLPVFISLFWSITLFASQNKSGSARHFLSFFMLIPFFLFVGHFLYFAPYPDLYSYYEFPQAFLGLLFFPLFHSYFRLLTIDEYFSLRKQYRHFIFPVILSLIYGLSIMATPRAEYRDWLYHGSEAGDSALIKLLDILRSCIRLFLIVQLFITIKNNHHLIKSYRDKAEQFYSDFEDTNTWNSKLLNYSIILMSTASVFALALGRSILLPDNRLIYLIWPFFSVSLYLIGFIGLKQKPINPAFESESGNNTNEFWSESVDDPTETLSTKIINALTVNKLYLNPDLCILDVAKAVGSNRTYVSRVINTKFNQNFCSFINDFRINELKNLIIEQSGSTAEFLSDSCGFGSVNSMNRAIFAKTGQPFKEFKNGIIQTNSTETSQRG